jgi:hypothetical protein
MQQIDTKKVGSGIAILAGIPLLLVIIFYSIPHLVGSIKVVIGVLLAIPLLIIFTSVRKKTLIAGMYILFISFVFGQRTIYIGNYIRVVPAELIIWFLFFLILVYNFGNNLKVEINFPRISKIFAGLLLIGILTTWFSNLSVQIAINYAKMLIVFIPTFYIVYNLVDNYKMIKYLVAIITTEAILLSFLGIAEYFGLGFIKYFPDFFTSPEALMSQSGFRRASASFWGGPLLSAFLMMSFPISLGYLRIVSSPVIKLLYAGGLILVLAFIYFAGFRGIWLGLLIAMLCYSYLKGAKRMLVFIIFIYIFAQLIPQEFFHRVEGLYSEQKDSSTIKRYGRAIWAVKVASENPIFGGGWGATGLVHSDILQVAGDCGIPTALAWFIFYFGVLIKLKRKIDNTQSGEQKEYMIAFFSFLAGFFIILSVEALIHLSEYYMPFWMMFALSSRIADLDVSETKNIKIEN